MGTAIFKQDGCDSCCAQNDSNNSQDVIALRPADSKPGFDTRKSPGAQPDSSAAKLSTDEGVTGTADFQQPADQDSVARWPSVVAGGSAEVSELVDVHESYDDGSGYDGQLLRGERHGHGIWKSVQETYEGEWLRDNRHGDGKQTWEDGRMYEGKFADGKFHGFGTMAWNTPQGAMVYEGEYVDDVKHGHGKYTWPDGRIYDGQWVDGTRSGKAILLNPKGEERRGIWLEDKLQRWIDDGAETA